MKSILDSIDNVFVLVVDVNDSMLIIITVRDLLYVADFLSLVHVADFRNAVCVLSCRACGSFVILT